MYSYGQYCPVARAAEVLGDRWTLLIVRDLLSGVHHFNELERGLPGIPRSLLAARLRRLEAAGIVEKRATGQGKRTDYHLTEAGSELEAVIDVLLVWGARWTLDEPRPDELDPLLLLWWMRGRVHIDRLPPGCERLVVQFDFSGPVQGRYWLVIARQDVSVCVRHPGFEIDVLVTADLSTLFQVWLGRMRYGEAQRSDDLRVETSPALARLFPRLFALSVTAPALRRARLAKARQRSAV